MTNHTDVKRYTGLVIIESVNSNPNGDPNEEGSPRRGEDGKGVISPVSFKRKIRDMIADKEGIVWRTLQAEMGLAEDQFKILEVPDRDRKVIKKEVADGVFKDRYWDARVFGSTFLEKGAEYIRTGVAQFGVGVSLGQIEIVDYTYTVKSSVQEGRERGLAPGALKVVGHGVYVMPFTVNPSVAHKSGCTQKDVDLLFRVLPYTYSNTVSQTRTQVYIRHIWVIEHKSALGSCGDPLFYDAMTPMRKGDDPRAESVSWDDYDVPTKLPDELMGKVAGFRDLVDR